MFMHTCISVNSYIDLYGDNAYEESSLSLHAQLLPLGSQLWPVLVSVQTVLVKEEEEAWD